jgi:UDP-glucose:(heptosyl)LPS alpha-1,3-glucosyltransferase
MKRYCFFVHELERSVGHSNALIETVKRLPDEIICNSTFYCFTHDKNLESEFPSASFVNFRPFLKYPFLFKAITFHLHCFRLKLKKNNNDIWISIGTANLWPDIVNIQFISHQWSQYYFKITQLGFASRLYKKLLFLYLNWNENYVFRRQPYCSVLAPFMRDFLQGSYGLDEDHIRVIPSSVNMERFSPREVNYSALVERYPVLKGLDLDQPVYLFVGALERKGFPYALKALEKLGDAQFIVIGRGEFLDKSELVSKKVSLFHIPFTREVEYFFNIADCFIFPTIYEPFGLVIFEAYAAGLDIYVSGKMVGASGLISDDPDVHLIENIENIDIVPVGKLDFESRLQRYQRREKTLKKYNWEYTAGQFNELIRSSGR